MSACILTVSIVLVRKVALRQITGQLDLVFVRKKRRLKSNISGGTLRIRSVKNPPLFWKELRLPLLGRRKKTVLFCIAASLIILLLTYLFLWSEEALDDQWTHSAYAVIFLLLGMLFTLVIPATAITSEKESGSWPLLLTTTQSDWQIIWAKFFGVLRRVFPAWLFLFGHLILFTFLGLIHPLIFFLMTTLVIWLVVFLSSTGLYFSTLFKKTTTAVIMNFAFAAFLWAFVPFVIGLISSLAEASDHFLGWYLDFNPVVEAAVLMQIMSGRDWFRITWPQGPESVDETFIFMHAVLFTYCLA